MPTSSPSGLVPAAAATAVADVAAAALAAAAAAVAAAAAAGAAATVPVTAGEKCAPPTIRLPGSLIQQMPGPGSGHSPIGLSADLRSPLAPVPSAQGLCPADPPHSTPTHGHPPIGLSADLRGHHASEPSASRPFLVDQSLPSHGWKSQRILLTRMRRSDRGSLRLCQGRQREGPSTSLSCVHHGFACLNGHQFFQHPFRLHHCLSPVLTYPSNQVPGTERPPFQLHLRLSSVSLYLPLQLCFQICPSS